MSPQNLVLVLFLVAPLAVVFLFVRFVRGSRRGGTSTVRLLVGNGLLLLALALSVLPVGEIYYRFVYDASDGFDLGLASERWFERYYQRNAQGVRDSVDLRGPRSADRPRFTFIGDSYTNGHGLKDVEQRFVNRIRASRPEWDVQYIGDDGLETAELALRLSEFVRDGLQLEHVVYVHCGNDISDLVEEWRVAARKIYEDQPGWLLRHSWFLNTWYYRLRVSGDSELVDYFDMIAAAYQDGRWQLQSRRLAQLKDLVEQAGGQLHVVSFPFFETMDDPGWRAIHAQLTDYWKRVGVRHLDLLPTFESQPATTWQINRWDTHGNVHAHEQAARVIQEFLEESRRD